jgi:hypothetical protein
MSSIPEIDQQLITQLTRTRDGYDRLIVSIIKSLDASGRMDQFRESLSKALKQQQGELSSQTKFVYHVETPLSIRIL